MSLSKLSVKDGSCGNLTKEKEYIIFVVPGMEFCLKAVNNY